MDKTRTDARLWDGSLAMGKTSTVTETRRKLIRFLTAEIMT